MTAVVLPLPIGTNTPLPESTVGAPGAAASAADALHSHPRVTSVTTHVSDANGEAVIAFTRSFPPVVVGSNPTWPGVNFSYYEAADNPPVVCKVKAWATDGNGNFTGCTVKLYRSQVMPAQNSALSLATLLTGVVTALNTLAGLISGFNSFGGSAANVPFSFIAIMRSN